MIMGRNTRFRQLEYCPKTGCCHWRPILELACVYISHSIIHIPTGSPHTTIPLRGKDYWRREKSHAVCRILPKCVYYACLYCIIMRRERHYYIACNHGIDRDYSDIGGSGRIHVTCYKARLCPFHCISCSARIRPTAWRLQSSPKEALNWGQPSTDTTISCCPMILLGRSM